MMSKKTIAFFLVIIIALAVFLGVKKLGLSTEDIIYLKKLYLPSPNIIYQEMRSSGGLLPPEIKPSHQEVTLYKSGKLVATGTEFNSTSQLTPQAMESLSKTIDQSDIFDPNCKKENIYPDTNFTYHISYRNKFTTITSYNSSCLEKIEPIKNTIYQHLKK
jgi:TATA-box binding protein (TBP) (component of TFIID and TFIIIB)